MSSKLDFMRSRLRWLAIHIVVATSAFWLAALALALGNLWLCFGAAGFGAVQVAIARIVLHWRPRFGAPVVAL